jgi:hypothetical protein
MFVDFFLILGRGCAVLRRRFLAGKTWGGRGKTWDGGGNFALRKCFRFNAANGAARAMYCRVVAAAVESVSQPGTLHEALTTIRMERNDWNGWNEWK